VNRNDFWEDASATAYVLSNAILSVTPVTVAAGIIGIGRSLVLVLVLALLEWSGAFSCLLNSLDTSTNTRRAHDEDVVNEDVVNEDAVNPFTFVVKANNDEQ